MSTQNLKKKTYTGEILCQVEINITVHQTHKSLKTGEN